MNTAPEPNSANTAQTPWMCMLAMALVGSTVPISKLIGQTMDPFVATVLRHAAALPVLLVGLWLQARPWPRLDRRDQALLALQAASGSVGYTVLLIAGVQWASAADASVATGTLPAVAALFSFVVLGERPTLRLLMSMGLATLGVLLLVWMGAQPASTAGHSALGVVNTHPTAPIGQRFFGLALVLGAVVCEAVFILGQGRLKARLTPLQMSVSMSVGGLLLCAVPAMVRWPSTGLVWHSTAMAGVLYYAWVGTVGGFVLWYAGTARTTPAGAALATACLPLSAFALSAWGLGEGIHPLQGVAMGCVLLAMLIPTYPRRCATTTTSSSSQQNTP